MLGSPFYGTLLATAAVEPGGSRFPGDAYQVGIGTFVWILIHSAIAAIFFAATLATFDRCLGRVSKTADEPIPRPRQRPLAQLEPEF
jgi:hypothetical protein